MQQRLSACVALLAATLLLAAAGHAEEKEAAFRLDNHLPDRLSIRLSSRTRYEYLANDFRFERLGDRDILEIKTLLHGRFRATDWLSVGAELQDSRAYLEDRFLNTGIVNAVELMQAYLEINQPLLHGYIAVRGGRVTIDFGTRRLIARNRYRNTINGFTGLDARWRSGLRELRALWVLPVQRLPFTPEQLTDNGIRFDRESFNVQLWALYFSDEIGDRVRGEAYVIGLHESDSSGRPTRNRTLFTPGFRIFRPPATGDLDFELEAVVQTGESRASAASREDLDHLAWFVHAELGYRFDFPWKPRLIAQFDYASGDQDPDDDENNRFDTLFGARRGEFGPTSIYGPFFRANLNSPGLRLKLRPTNWIQAFTAVRGFWLASNRDAWVGSDLRDPTGVSSGFLGTQWEGAIKFEVVPGNLTVETGVAHLWAGSYQRDDDAASTGDSTYGYLQVTLSL